MNEMLWHTEFESPMPDGMTYEMFNHMAKKKQSVEVIRLIVQFIQEVQMVDSDIAETIGYMNKLLLSELIV